MHDFHADIILEKIFLVLLAAAAMGLLLHQERLLERYYQQVAGRVLTEPVLTSYMETGGHG